MLKANSVLKELDLSANAPSDYVTDGSGFAKELAVGLGANGALEKLLMGGNEIKGAEAGKALGDAIASSTMLKELDLSGKPNKYGGITPGCDVEFAQTFSVGLGSNGAMTKLIMSMNGLI